MAATTSSIEGIRGPFSSMSSLSKSDIECMCRKRDRRRRVCSKNSILLTPQNIINWRLRSTGCSCMLWLALLLVLSHLYKCEAFVYSSPPVESTLASGVPSRQGGDAYLYHSRQLHGRLMSQSDCNGEHAKHNGHQIDKSRIIPRHVAFICDGNSRWAQARGLPDSAGHLAGADRLIDTLETLKRTNVECCTFYGFSTENWKRSDIEIRDILYVMEQTARKFYSKALQERVRVKIIGDLEDTRIPSGLREILYKLEKDTTDFPSTSLTVCIAVNYGGRQDILNASLKLAHAIASGDVKADDVTEDDFASLLYTSDLPDPDLMIRTGGEKRLSNFLLWNCAYSELYFSDDLWPDFDEASIQQALQWYSTRSRRFGGRKTSQIVAVAD